MHCGTIGGSGKNNKPMSAARIIPSQPFAFTVICPKDELVTVEFFAVPQFAAEHIGEIRIDWGDGSSVPVDVVMPTASLTEMLSGNDVLPVVHASHRYGEDGKRTVTISTPSGFLPLKALPLQTVSVASALPVLTVGETDPEGRPEASDTLPPLFPIDPKTGEAALNFLCPDFLANNPKLAFVDEAFAATSIKSIPVTLFSPCPNLKSLVRTFAASRIESVPYGLLRHAQTLSLCEETFANCPRLEEADNPFGDKKHLPVCLEGFMQGAAPRLFAWCDKSRREEAGWIRPPAALSDPSFAFDWIAVRGSCEPIVSFYPIDLELKGDLLIEWGDGCAELVDWNTCEALTHAYAVPGTYRVRIHSTPGEAVRPFQLGKGLAAVLTPLPPFHPRSLDSLGDFGGWAADRRRLERLPEDLFIHNPDIVNLEQAFAGCVKLAEVPDAILAPLASLENADGLFAFCKSLPALPASFVSVPRRHEFDCFAPEPADKTETAKEPL